MSITSLTKAHVQVLSAGVVSDREPIVWGLWLGSSPAQLPQGWLANLGMLSREDAFWDVEACWFGSAQNSPPKTGK